LDENSGTTATDSNGSNDGTANNERVFNSEASGIINTTADFTQGDDYVELTTFSGANFTTHSFSFWVKTTSTDFERIAGYINDGSLGDLILFTYNEGTVKYEIRAEGDITQVESSTNISDGNWHHIVGTYDKSNMKLYIDGSEENSTLKSHLLGSLDYPFTFGARNNRGTIEGFFNGDIDEFGIWERALTSEEVSELYNDGDGLSYENFGGQGLESGGDMIYDDGSEPEEYPVAVDNEGLEDFPNSYTNYLES
ncbi:MAG: LamG domain-containing protein, partial [Elusimicrobiota bacterium]